MILSLRQLNQLWGPPSNLMRKNLDDPLGPVCTDTRQLERGNFYVPLIGDKFNGHAFLDQAFRKGAQAAVISEDSDIKVPENLMHWKVSNTTYAYQQLGMLNRLSLNIPVVAVTGSVGKTTTKELIKSTLSSLGPILSTNENENNDVGVPTTLLKGTSDHVVAVIEMGMRGLGEIERLSYCTKPDIAVITNIGNAHIGRLGSRNEIAKAKCEITSSLSSNGVVIIPANDPLLERTLRQTWTGRIVRVELLESKDIERSREDAASSPSFLRSKYVANVDLEKGYLSLENHIAKLPLEGKHNAINFLFAIAVARELNVSWENIENVTINPLRGRNNIIKFGEITVFDETYNASPESVMAALELLINQPGRHFAVLGTMHELGEYSLTLHREIARKALNIGLDGLVIVSNGPEAEIMYSEAKSIQYLELVSLAEDALIPLKSWLKPGDNLLIKGSRDLKLEKLISLLKLNII